MKRKRSTLPMKILGSWPLSSLEGQLGGGSHQKPPSSCSSSLNSKLPVLTGTVEKQPPAHFFFFNSRIFLSFFPWLIPWIVNFPIVIFFCKDLWLRMQLRWWSACLMYTKFGVPSIPSTAWDRWGSTHLWSQLLGGEGRKIKCSESS